MPGELLRGWWCRVYKFDCECKNLIPKFLLIVFGLTIFAANFSLFAAPMEQQAESPPLQRETLFTEEDMRQLERQVRCATPDQAAQLLEDFAFKYGLDLEARPTDTSLLAKEHYVIQVGPFEIPAEPGVDVELETAVVKASDANPIPAILQLQNNASLLDLSLIHI